MKRFSGKVLHIIALDVPEPPDYGGVIDIYYKIKALAALEINIILHCFQFGRSESKELETICQKVYYYPRKTGWKGWSLSLPYSVYSRRDKSLLKNLLEDNAPILMEGVHCSFLLNHQQLKDRTILLRNHNIEAEYFKQLAERSDGYFMKLYRYREAILFKKLERQLQRVNTFLPISASDKQFFQTLYPENKVSLIPAFDSEKNEVHIKEGKGHYVLYQGNLQHPENEEAVNYILENVVPKMPDVSFVFAGRNPKKSILERAKNFKNVEIIANPSQQKMDELIQEAQIHLLLSFQATGIKLKLLTALRKGRFVIANPIILKGNLLDELCTTAEDASEIIEAIQELMKKMFTQQDIEKRISVFDLYYNPEKNAEKILSAAFESN